MKTGLMVGNSVYQTHKFSLANNSVFQTLLYTTILLHLHKFPIIIYENMMQVIYIVIGPGTGEGGGGGGRQTDGYCVRLGKYI